MYIIPEEYEPGTLAAIPLQTRKRGNPGSKRAKRKYKDVICTFDIETTRLEDIEQSIMYVWQMHFHHHFSMIGRTWHQLESILESFANELNDDETIIIFIHNLSYEFQFLRAIHEWKTEEVFAVSPRKVLKTSMFDGKIEFRCTYLHSNMSLEEFTKKMDVEHKKLDGEAFDYTIKRYPWTPLSEYEIRYCLHDVIGLAECLEKEMEIDGDTLYTLPLTSTGYVRRDVKAAMRSCKQWAVKPALLTLEVYKLCREAFRGGDTHASRYWANMVLTDVFSADRVSSYPDVICNCDFPITAFEPIGKQSIDEVVRLMVDRKKALLLRVALTRPRLRDCLWGFPYISKDKCRNLQKGRIDNGRVLEAEYLETTLTDVDLKIILDQYTFDDIVCFDVHHARYGKLPRVMTDVVKDYFRKKTELKGVAGQEVQYMKSKNKVNACYGMTAQDPVKQDVIFDNGDWSEAQEDMEVLLNKSNEKAFLCYQWGVWVTAHARRELQDMLKIAGHNAVYCDTDSVKYVGKADFTAYNETIMERSKANGAFATDIKGRVHYMGIAEPDGHYTQFKTLGAKKYVFTKPGSDTVHVTIAGVNKKRGGPELQRAGGVAAFAPGFTFIDAGGTESVYNDHPENGTIIIDDHTLHITPNVVIRDSTYTVGLTAEYARLLDFDIKNLDISRDLW